MSINYDRRGSGEALVLLHGIGHRWQAWLPVLPRLARHHEVIAIDLPGFGGSPVPTGGMPRDMAGLVALVRSELADLGLDRPHMAGNSLGGAVALELAAAGAAASVTALAPAGFYTHGEGRHAMTILGLLRASTFVPESMLRRAVARRWVRHLTFGELVCNPDRLDRDRLLGDCLALRQGKGYWPIGMALRSYSFAGMALPADSAPQASLEFDGRPDVPVTVAWGSRDRILRPWQADRARVQLPLAVHVTLPRCGHVPMSDDPALVARVILRTTGARSTAGSGNR